jgi:hypothetical protein
MEGDAARLALEPTYASHSIGPAKLFTIQVVELPHRRVNGTS